MAMFKNPKVDLKRKQKKVFQIGLIFVLAFMVAAFKFFPQIDPINGITVPPQDLINAEDIINTKQDTKPLPPPKPEVILNQVEDEILDNFVFDNVEFDNNDIPALPPPQPVLDTRDEPNYFDVAETMPAPIGGLQAIQKRIVYPEIAKRINLQGRVIVLAYVDEEGNVSKTEILKSVNPLLDDEAVKSVMLTKFTPGIQRGKPVKVKVAIPIQFKLN